MAIRRRNNQRKTVRPLLAPTGYIALTVETALLVLVLYCRRFPLRSATCKPKPLWPPDHILWTAPAFAHPRPLARHSTQVAARGADLYTIEDKPSHRKGENRMIKDLYYLDLEAIPLEQFKQRLATKELLPARQILKQEIDARFEQIAAMGIDNLNDLIDALKTRRRMEAFAEASGLPRDYIVVLRREAKGILPKPVYLDRIPGVDTAHAEQLAAVGIKHSKHLFERAQTPGDRTALSEATSLPADLLLEWVKLSDLARIPGLGPVFVRLFYEAGADTLEKLARWDPGALSQKAHVVNRERRLSKVVPSLKDIAHYVDMAGALPKVIQYE